jgi:hypothetical protein
MPDTAIDSAVCVNCAHPKLHHGHFGPVNGDLFGRWTWQDERRCHVWVAPLGKRKTGGRCPCRGWDSGEAPSPVAEPRE